MSGSSRRAGAEPDNAFSLQSRRVLYTSPLFAGLSEDEFGIVTALLKRLRVPKGRAVFREGDSGGDMFILVSGSLRAFVSQSDGTHRWMFNIYPGDFFGEMSIIVREPRSATITAREETELAVLQGLDFFHIVFGHPLIGIKLLKAISAVQAQWFDESAKSYSGLMRWGETARRRAITDELTGLYNHRFLEESIKDRFDHGSVGLRKMALMMMDLDKVHLINERHGPQGGDQAIIVMAEVLRSIMRSGDIAARLSGDEFSVLLPDTDIEDARHVAERIREEVQRREIQVPQSPGAGENIIITICTSIGIAVAPVHADSGEALFRAADQALRTAKERGRNRVETAD